MFLQLKGDSAVYVIGTLKEPQLIHSEIYYPKQTPTVGWPNSS